MSILLIWAIICMTLALTFYTIGVFAERKMGTLLKWHCAVFWLGFLCDSTGTTIMGQLSGNTFSFSLHGITGLIALLLMAFHAIWATVILIKRDDQAKKTFHKFSIVVWSVWLIPYIVGLFIGMF
ncbi:HsmA family protein [Anaerovorax odorimutans]|uniref:HsmA family protein n=1 Tax=Anaerovorax odorimutans TaxID=109327 RepID=A0ABT1RP68_9FIRM|nr:HsmA family protein [Anaerovorax odorimutans]MCQ4636989.1 HsmA family protein [Anaerovorax odorimutans]